MATTLQPPPERRAPDALPQRVQAVGVPGPHRARRRGDRAAALGREPAAVRVAAGVYFWVGYQTVVEDGVVVFDALDRLTRAYMVWHNEPPKLAAIGFVFPPLTTMVFLPFTVIKPLATSLVALPLTSAIFGGAMVVAMNRLFARCSMPGLQRWLVLAVFALNPLIVFYAGNGMSELAYLALLTFSLYCFASWVLTTQPRFLVGAAMAFSLLVLLRYSFGIWAIVVAVLLDDRPRPPRRRDRRDRGDAHHVPRAARLRARRVDPLQLAHRRRPAALAEQLGRVRRQRAAGRHGRQRRHGRGAPAQRPAHARRLRAGDRRRAGAAS